MSRTELIERYKERDKPNLDRLLSHYNRLAPFEEVIKDAALAKTPEGKRHPHQRRIRKEVLEHAAKVLLDSIDEINSCNSFESLIELVEEKTKELKGFGELAIYDTSLRIGVNKNIYPPKVYIHAGTREGVKVLGLEYKSKALEVQSFPESIRALQPWEIEDFLCIYKGKS